MRSDKNFALINGEQVPMEKFYINFMDNTQQEYIVDPRSVRRIKEQITDVTSPVFEVANCIYYKDKIKSFQF